MNKPIKNEVIKQVNLVPNFITAFSLACGLFVIFKGVHTHHVVTPYQLMHAAMVLLIIAAIADFLDGAIARAIKAESEFGFTFDTLSDAVTFAVAPSVMALKIASGIEPEGHWFFICLASCMIFSICGVLRLVRFNVISNKSKGNSQEEFALKKNFIGLPTPASALTFASLVLFLTSDYADAIPDKIKLSLIASFALLLGYLMVSRSKFPSLKSLHVKVPTFDLIFLSVVIAVVILYGILYYLPIVLLALMISYVLFGMILTIVRFFSPKK
jgi:CDP-diacylglycerol--serine O-phosphatidyltransferase